VNVTGCLDGHAILERLHAEPEDERGERSGAHAGDLTDAGVFSSLLAGRSPASWRIERKWGENASGVSLGPAMVLLLNPNSFA
jgi:hypothetical protein